MSEIEVIDTSTAEGCRKYAQMALDRFCAEGLVMTPGALGMLLSIARRVACSGEHARATPFVDTQVEASALKCTCAASNLSLSRPDWHATGCPRGDALAAILATLRSRVALVSPARAEALQLARQHKFTVEELLVFAAEHTRRNA